MYLRVVDLYLDCIYVRNYFEYFYLDFIYELCQYMYLDLDVQVVDLCPPLQYTNTKMISGIPMPKVMNLESQN